MNNNYKIYQEYNLGIAKLEPGVKSFEELYDLAKMIREDSDFSKVYYQVTDLRGCLFDFERAKIDHIANLIERYQEIDNQKIGVYIIDKPLETAYIQLFFDKLKYKREYCSTIQKAYNILGLRIPFDQFKKLIDI